MKDDAGKDVRVLNPNGFAEWPVKGDRRIALLITRVWFLQRRGAQKWQRWMPIVTFGSLLLLPFLLVFLPRGLSRGLQGGLFVLAFTPVLGALAFFQWKAWRGGMKSVLEWILAEGLCPSCGYNLHGLAADAGGCVACSECGAAWKRERILRSAAFEEGAEMGRAPLRLGSPRYQGSWTRDAIGGVVIVPMGLFTSATTDERLSDDMAALARARKLWKCAGWRFARWMFVGMALTLGGTVLTGVGFTRVILRTMDNWTMWAMALGGVTVLIGAVILRLTLGKTPRNAAGELLGERLCPGCLSALRGEADADGLVACGYCGARWRLTPSMSDRSGP